MLEQLKHFLESDIGIVLSFVSLVLDYVAKLFLLVKVLKWVSKIESNTVKGILLLSTILIIGLIAPVIIFIFTPWHGWFPIILKILSAYSLFNFFGLIYVWVTMEKMLKKNNIQ